ncbi:MAG: nucleoside 2-deoxyribosyltransferase [Alistipes sp.]|nr:nucleoside 2-deoxyribosyltransferase [Alistipes sp.]
MKYKALNQSWDLLNGAGDPRIAQPNAEYDIRICVVGSKITLYVNDVLAASAEHIIRETQFQIYMNGDDEITIKDFEVSLDPSKVFVIMQFTEEYNQLYSEVVKPVCEQYGLKCERGDDYCTTTMIIQDIADSINEASVVIAEITPDNPNVFYEVGYAHASKKPTILLCDKKRPKLPFDISSFRTLFYDNTIAGKTKVETDLRKYLDTILNKS